MRSINRATKDTKEHHQSNDTAEHDQGIELGAAGFEVFETFSAAQCE